jgi:hypothetical protein
LGLNFAFCASTTIDGLFLKTVSILAPPKSQFL